MLIPVFYYSLSVACALLALRSESNFFRRLLLVPLILFASLAFRRLNEFTSAPDHASITGMFVLVWVSHMVITLTLDLHISSKPKTAPAAGSWKAAYKILWNLRWQGTALQAPGMQKKKEKDEKPHDNDHAATDQAAPQLSKAAESHPAWLTPRRAFLLQKLTLLTAIYAINNLYWYLLTSTKPLHPTDYDQTHQSIIRRSLFPISIEANPPTTRELHIRTALVAHFLWASYSSLTSHHAALALFFVGTGIDEPEEWPPLHGDLSQASSLRRFWGRFWHRLTYRTYLVCGTLVAEKVFGLRKKGGAGYRFVVEGLVFLASGLIHAVVTWQLGFRCGYLEDIWWFGLNFAGMMVEGVVQKYWAAYVKWRRWGGRGSIRAMYIERVVGWVWVFAFLWWSLPKTEFPKIRCAPGSV